MEEKIIGINRRVAVGCVHDVSTKWDKEEDNKTQTKTNKITEHANIRFIKTEKKTLIGRDIELYYLKAIIGDSTISSLDFELSMLNNIIKHGERIVNIHKSYICEYEVWDYGGVEVKYYKSIKEVGTNRAVGIIQTEPKAKTYKRWKWEVRGEAKARIRFRARYVWVAYTRDIFIYEELQTECVSYMQQDGIYVNICRYFDRNTRFARATKGGIVGYMALADTPNRDFIEVTIYHKVSNENITTYFGISPFLNAKRNITMF